MAEQVVIPGSDYPAKIRSLWAVALLPLVTLGIYFFVWYYKINKEMASLGRARGRSRELGDSPGKSLLAVTLGALIIVPAIVSLVHTFQRIQLTQRLTREGDVLNGWIALILYILLNVAFPSYIQSELNKVWRKVGTPLPGESLSPQPGEMAPQQEPPPPSSS